MKSAKPALPSVGDEGLSDFSFVCFSLLPSSIPWSRRSSGYPSYGLPRRPFASSRRTLLFQFLYSLFPALSVPLRFFLFLHWSHKNLFSREFSRAGWYALPRTRCINSVGSTSNKKEEKEKRTDQTASLVFLSFPTKSALLFTSIGASAKAA